MPMRKKQRNKCLMCKTETVRPSYKYCSNLCQAEYRHEQYINKWKIGEISGLTSLGIVSKPIKKYLRMKFNNKCVLCGWSQVNLQTGVVPLVADHMDGNWKNNREDNLRLICPNCDALSPTFAGLNKGNGRSNRTMSRRAIEGRVMITKEE